MQSSTIYVEWIESIYIDTEITEEMIRSSEVFDGIRMYPYVTIDDERKYLEGLR